VTQSGGSATGGRRVEPRATYRLQLNAAFPFAAAEALVPYLAELGASHLYLSPILQAAPGSTHGYDVVDPSLVSEDLGGEPGLASLVRAARALDLGIVLDIVPNHLSIAGEANPWWWDVLENGPASRYAGHFDVEWDHPEPHLRDRVLVPVLEDHYGRVLEAGGIRLAWDGRRSTVVHGEHVLPVAPESLAPLLDAAAERADSPELAFIADALRTLPRPGPDDLAGIERRRRDRAVLLVRLRELAAREPAVDEAIDAVVARTNADADALDTLLEAQAYRLAWWRSARRDLGYRRFFDVTTLAGLRMEDERVFLDTHQRVLPLLAEGDIDGLRVDHPDGLRDPEEYLRRLRWHAPRAWIVVEKILEPGETLRPSWPVEGTTGYDFLREVDGLFVDPAGEASLAASERRMTGRTATFDALARASRLHVLRELLGSELTRLTALLLDVLEGHRRHRDHTRHDLHEALTELLADWPVYRTYVRVEMEATGPAPRVSPEDEAVVASAVAAATDHRPDLPADLFELLGRLLLLRLPGSLETEFAMRFQQLTGAVMAKGVEDTAFYRDLRLPSLDEVGGDPASFGTTPTAFHEAMAARASERPLAMLTTSTHDTKRSEDVRARLHVLSEVPDRWAAAVERWSAMLASHRTADGPDGHAEYLLYETLVGAWPIDEGRLLAYLEKALREAKLRTSWALPDMAYEEAVRAFAGAALADASFTSDVEAFVRSILMSGRINGLATVLVKLTAPGVPDIYRGTELWDLSLVDPDDRRPVDFGLRGSLLEDLDGTPIQRLVEGLDALDEPGAPKLHIIRRALELRRERPGWFGPGAGYVALASTGRWADRVVAFARADMAVTVVPRLSVAPAGDWADTSVELPEGRWTDRLSDATYDGGDVLLARLFGGFPVALLARTDA
jgi:(1->4)-alpha-D-glucan 1-alpha-D-glucosylmutase